ncbi:hypothetical protein [Clavibacter phage 33]|nr:hypothetical protein [Clavibacter phage 33]
MDGVGCCRRCRLPLPAAACGHRSGVHLMRAFLISLPGVPVFTVHADDRRTARNFALGLHGYTVTPPRFITVTPV